MSNRWRSIPYEMLINQTTLGFLQKSLFIQRISEHIFIDKDRHFGGDRDRDCVAGAAIDFDEFTRLSHAKFCEVGVFLQVVDHHILKFATQSFNGRDDQVVREWPRRFFTADAPADAHDFEDSDDNGKRAIPIDLFQDDDMLIINNAADDPTEFHLNWHGHLGQSASRH